MEVSAKQPSLTDLAVVIAPWAHIKQIRLVRSVIESNISQEPPTSQLHHTFDATTTLNRERQILTVHVSLAVWLGDFVRITAEFVLEYAVAKSPVEVNDQVDNAFGKMTGVYNAWPYWREYVQSTISRLGLPPLALPLITAASMMAYYAEKEKGTMESDSPSTPA